MIAMLDNVVRLLNAYGVEFIVIGGWAADLHGSVYSRGHRCGPDLPLRDTRSADPTQTRRRSREGLGSDRGIASDPR